MTCKGASTGGWFRLRAGRSAFTLLEMLVVVAIIGILAVLLFPVVRTGLDSARTAGCLANMKQIGAGIALFGADQEGTTPLEYYAGPSPESPGNSVWWYWADLIQPYTDSAKPRPVSGGAGDSILERANRSTVYDCPANRLNRFDYKFNQRVGNFNISRGMQNNSFAAVETGIKGMRGVFGVRLDAVIVANRSAPPPSQFILVMDSVDPEYPGMANFNSSFVRTRYVGMHGESMRFNAAYADGHSSSLSSNVLATYTNGLPFDLPPGS